MAYSKVFTKRNIRKYKQSFNKFQKKAKLYKKPDMGGFKITRFYDGPLILTNTNAAGNVTTTNSAPGASVCLTASNTSAEFVSANIYNVPFTMQFSLDQIAGYTDIVNIADKYCLYGVSVRARYSGNDILPQSTLVNVVPAIRWVADYDDATIQSPTELREKMGLRTKRLDSKDAKMYIVPKTAGLIYQDLTPTIAYGENKTRYIDTKYPTVQHFGIKGYIENFALPSSSEARAQIHFEVKYYVKAKNLE